MIPYRDLTHPPMTVWELREIRRRLVDDGRRHIDESAIFAAHGRLRDRTEAAVTQTKRLRRERSRSINRPPPPKLMPTVTPAKATPSFDNVSFKSVAPFDVDDV
jgi:putative transposase